MNILVTRFSALGDLVTLEITFRAIRYFFPEAHIVLLTSKVGKELYQDTHYFDDIKVISPKIFFQTWLMLRDSKFDISFNLQCNRFSHYLLTGQKIDKNVNSGSSFWRRLFGLKSPLMSTKKLFEIAGVNVLKIDNYLQKKDSLLIRLPVILDTNISKMISDFRENCPLIAISPGASEKWISKKWGETSYVALIQMLESYGYKILLVGSSAEKEIGDNIQGKSQKVLNLVGKTTMSELKQVLSMVDIFIGNDSGPVHIAAGVGTKTITIFGPTSTKHWVGHGFYHGKHVYCVTHQNLSCLPCYKSKCPTKHECMTSISVEEVYDHVLTLLER